MRISAVRPFMLAWPEPNDFDSIRMTVLVAVDTDAGITGWGEAIAMWPEACKATRTIMLEGFATPLIGRDPCDVAGAWAAMKAHSWWYGEGGIATLALSGLDMALWDIAAKERGKPLVELLAGRAHGRLPVCASLHVNEATIEESVETIAGHVAKGFRSAKLGLGKRGLSRAGRDPDYDIALVSALRSAIGPTPGIMVDAGNGTVWSLETATRVVRAMEKDAIAWIEEPFHPSRVEDHRALKAAVDTPIAAGEREWSVDGYKRWLATGAVDVFGIDPGRVEGVTGFLRAQNAIEAGGGAVNAHAWSTAVLTAASLHLSLAAPSARLFELKPKPGPMQFELIDEPFWHESGWVSAPARAGHGAEPKLSVIAKYEVH